MKQKIFSVYDTKLEAYMQPFFFTAKGQALRAFADLSNDTKTSIGQHPEDYCLFEIGEWDDQKAMLTPLKAPIALGNAIEYIKKEQ